MSVNDKSNDDFLMPTQNKPGLTPTSLAETVWTSKVLFDSAIWSGVISPSGEFADGPHEIILTRKGVQVQAHVVCIVKFDDPTAMTTIESLGEYFKTSDVTKDYYTRWRISNVLEDGLLEEMRKDEQ